MQPAKISRHPREELLPDTSACVFCRAVVFNQRDKLSSASSRRMFSTELPII